MIGSDIFLACHDAVTDELYGDVEPCLMCKRLIINAGIARVIIRRTPDTYDIIDTSLWVENDDTGFTDGY